MLHQFLRTLILLMCTDVYPRAIEWVTDDLLALRYEFLHKMGGMEKGVFWYLRKSPLLDEIDAGISVVVVFRLFDKPSDVATVKVKNT